MNPYFGIKYFDQSFWDEDVAICLSREGKCTVEDVNLPNGSILFKTSGSSGVAKWVVHTRASILSSAKLVNKHLSVVEDDIWLLVIPIYHVGGFGVLARSYLSGCQVVKCESSKWCAKDTVNLISQHCATITSLVPTQVVDIVNAELTAPYSIRAVIVGGGKLEHHIKERALELGWPLLESYGMTETGSQIATQRQVSSRAGIDLIEGWDVRVNNNGKLAVKGDGLMKGYYITGSVSRIELPFDSAGWFETSDLVRLEGDSLIFESRSDRRIKVLGELVDLDQFELLLRDQCGCQVCLVDVFDERRGAKIVPVIERGQYSSHIESLLLKQSGLRKLEPLLLLDTIPLNEMGKIDRTQLRDSVVISNDNV